MTWTSEQNAITSRFSAGTSVPLLAWDSFNGPKFDPPKVNPSAPAAAIWARLTVVDVPGASAPLSGVSRPGPVGIGSAAPNYREGQIIVQHFAPVGSGEAALEPYVLETIALFHRASFGNVRCRDAEPPSRVGIDPGSEFAQINVTIPYYVLETL